MPIQLAFPYHEGPTPRKRMPDELRGLGIGQLWRGIQQTITVLRGSRSDLAMAYGMADVINGPDGQHGFFVKLFDDVLDNPKILEVGPFGFALYCAGLVHCHRAMSDGFIHRRKLRSLLDFTVTITDQEDEIRTFTVKAEEVAAQLVRAGLWEEAPDGFTVHDYLKHNYSRQQIEALRSTASGAAKAFWDSEAGQAERRRRGWAT